MTGEGASAGAERETAFGVFDGLFVYTCTRASEQARNLRLATIWIVRVLGRGAEARQVVQKTLCGEGESQWGNE